MRKTAIVLIVVAVAVVAGGVLYVRNLPEPKAPAVRNDTTLRNTEGGEVAGFIDIHGARAWMGVPFAQPRSASCAGGHRGHRSARPG